MAQGGIGLLAQTADDAEDPQTLRMVAGAIANLCGNGNLASFIEITCFLCLCVPLQKHQLWVLSKLKLIRSSAFNR
jgi:hypothetical protein